MRNESTKVVLDLIKKDRNVIAITADNGNEIYDQIKNEYPQQYIDYGIAECNMVASAAGLASTGKIPFLYAVTNFMAMRAFEFIRDVVCVPNYNVKFLGRSAGLVGGSMGMTHQGTEDLAILRTLPNLLVITPATPLEAKQATYAAYEYDGPVYIRLEGFNEPELYDESYQFQIGKGTIVRQGSDITLFSTGSIVNEALQATADLEETLGITMRIVNISTLRPIDREIIQQAAKETRGIITLEEHTIHGGLGSAVAEVLADSGLGVRFKRIGLDKFSVGCGNRLEMRGLNGIASKNIIEAVKNLLR